MDDPRHRRRLDTDQVTAPVNLLHQGMHWLAVTGVVLPPPLVTEHQPGLAELRRDQFLESPDGRKLAIREPRKKSDTSLFNTLANLPGFFHRQIERRAAVDRLAVVTSGQDRKPPIPTGG